LLKPDNNTGPLPAIDKIPVQIGSTVTDQVVVPTYPVLEYGHVASGGDAIGSGYVYNGKALPALRGKFVSRTFRQAVCGMITKTCSRPMTGTRKRWRRYTR
jgi:hypothetical protein